MSCRGSYSCTYTVYIPCIHSPKCAWSCGVMVSTLDFESKDPSSSLGRTSLFFSFSPLNSRVWTYCFLSFLPKLARQVQRKRLFEKDTRMYGKRWQSKSHNHAGIRYKVLSVGYVGAHSCFCTGKSTRVVHLIGDILVSKCVNYLDTMEH